ncbi:retrotransposon protein, putative, ty1-copia subclass [Tanacetum coccineum]
MIPLAAQLERKPRRDRGTRSGRQSTSSSSSFDQPSSSHLNDDDDDGNDEGTSCASTPSPIRYFNSLTNQVPQVFQNPHNIDPHLELFYTRQTEIINRQVQLRDEHRGAVRRNSPSYQAELKKRKDASMASTSGIFTIELYAFPNKTWVYDMGYGTHICNTLQGLRKSKKLKHGALSLCMGNGMRAAVEAIRSFDLILPSGLIIVLDNCHFAPTITRGVVLISCLVKNGYSHTFTNYGISILKDNVFYFDAIPHDGIYEIDMYNLYPNVSSNYNVSNKRAKHGLDSYYLWHCRLGHINKKRMDMLQRDGLLQPTHDESHEKCKSCISRKMARKPFPHQVERAKDLLGLIHTDVCGPFRNVSKKGANYFITFTDDFSRHDRKDTSNAPDIYGYYVDVEEYELEDLDEPPNYKAALVDPESDK